MSLYVKFVGAIGTVTGSCTWLYHEPTDTQFLVDCGMYQGESGGDQLNEKKFPFDPSKIAFVLLTHAHVDHCGLLPKLCKEGFKGKVYCLAVTAELTALSLQDTSKLVGKLYNKRDTESVHFTHIDAGSNRPCRSFRLADNLTARSFRTSHILGSVGYEICWQDTEGEKRAICFTGDIGNNTDNNPYQALLKGRQRPSPYVEYIVSESTYGERERGLLYQSTEKRMEALKDAICKAYEAEGTPNIIIPAFALNRSQEILVDLVSLFLTEMREAPDNLFSSEESEEKLYSGTIKSGYIRRGLLGKGYSRQEIDRICSCFEPVVSESTKKRLLKLEKQEFGHLSDESEIISKAFELGLEAELNYKLRDDISTQDQGKIVEIMNRRFRAPQIAVNSNLAIQYNRVFAKWMTALKPGNTGKAEFANSELASRLGVSEDQLAEFLENLLRMDRSEATKINENCDAFHLFDNPSRLREKFPSIQISASGMCAAGPVVDLILPAVKSRNSTIILTGYQSPGTLGFSLKEVSEFQRSDEKPDFQFEVEDKLVRASSVKAKILDLSPYYSGHADVNGILDCIMYKDEEHFKGILPQATIFLNHGDDCARNALKGRIEKLSGSASNIRPVKEVILPDQSTGWFDLSKGVWSDPPVESNKSKATSSHSQNDVDQLARIITLLEEQNSLLNQINSQLDEGSRRSNPSKYLDDRGEIPE